MDAERTLEGQLVWYKPLGWSWAALSNVAEASIAAVLAVAEEAFADRRARPDGGGVVVAVLADAASGETAPGADRDLPFVHEAGPEEYCEPLCGRFPDAFRGLSRDNLRFAPVPSGREGRADGGEPPNKRCGAA